MLRADNEDLVRLPLSQGHFAIIDAVDFEAEHHVGFRRNEYQWVGRICDLKWHALVKRHTVYATVILRTPAAQLELRLHRAVMDAPAGILVDHRDHNGLNNRRENLRLTTFGGNSANRRPSAKGSSSFKGVGFHKQTGKWEACIRVNRVKRHLGLFKSEVEAAIAYNIAAIEAFGEFAALNQIEAA